VLPAARRSAVNAGTVAQRQVFSLVIAAPEPIRERFRGQKLPAMLKTAANLRVHASWDVETTTTVTALRSLARRAAPARWARKPPSTRLEGHSRLDDPWERPASPYVAPCTSAPGTGVTRSNLGPAT
jgi:hypothetical protein